MAVTIYNEVSLDKLSEFKQKIVEGSGLSNEDVEALKKELQNTQALCVSVGKQLAQTKVDDFKKDKLILNLGKEQAKAKLEVMTLKKEIESK